MADAALDTARRDYDDTTALDGVSLIVSDGEILDVLGPSGCGKTTTLRTVAGFKTPTDGTVKFDGEDMTNVSPENRNVRLVFQEYALLDNMTIAENVVFGPKMQGVGKCERRNRIAELLDMFDIGEMGDCDPTTLFGGQQQRVGLTRVLAIEPSVLSLDEPMTGLDVQLKARLWTEVGTLLAELDVTGPYVTHDQVEAMVICDRVAVLNEGRVEQVGTPREIYESPATEFVSEFVAFGAPDLPFVSW